MTDQEFEIVTRLRSVRAAKAFVEDVADHELIADAEYAQVRGILRSWEQRLQDGVSIRKAPKSREAS